MDKYYLKYEIQTKLFLSCFSLSLSLPWFLSRVVITVVSVVVFWLAFCFMSVVITFTFGIWIVFVCGPKHGTSFNFCINIWNCVVSTNRAENYNNKYFIWRWMCVHFEWDSVFYGSYNICAIFSSQFYIAAFMCVLDMCKLYVGNA